MSNLFYWTCPNNWIGVIESNDDRAEVLSPHMRSIHDKKCGNEECKPTFLSRRAAEEELPEVVRWAQEQKSVLKRKHAPLTHKVTGVS